MAAAQAFGTAGLAVPDPLAGWAAEAAEADSGKAFLARCSAAPARAMNARWRETRAEATRHDALQRDLVAFAARPGGGLLPISPPAVAAGEAEVSAALAAPSYGEALVKMAGLIAVQAAYRTPPGKTNREDSLAQGRGAYALLGLRAAPPNVALLLGLAAPVAAAPPAVPLPDAAPG